MTNSESETRAKLRRASRIPRYDTSYSQPAAPAADIPQVSSVYAIRRRWWPLRTFAIAALLAALAWAVFTVTNIRSYVAPDKYQAISLTNGQVYFGKLSNGPVGYVALEHPYVTQTVQPAEAGAGDTSAPTTTLVKVRDQVYGPEDKMFIRTEHIAFWQNLRKDSKVMGAIQAKQGN